MRKIHSIIFPKKKYTKSQARSFLEKKSIQKDIARIDKRKIKVRAIDGDWIFFIRPRNRFKRLYRSYNGQVRIMKGELR